MRRFQDYLLEKRKRLDAASTLYLEQLRQGDGTWDLAAATRVGQMQAQWARQLETATLPVNLRKVTAPERALLRSAYCDSLREEAEPMRARAVDVLGRCEALAKKRKSVTAVDWADLCRAELERLRTSAGPTRPEGAKSVDPAP
jgi:hypothetical protein